MAITDEEILKVLIAEKRVELEKAELAPIKEKFEATWTQKLEAFEAEKTAQRSELLRLKEYQRDNAYDLKAEIIAVQETVIKS
jgi:hypothetical protein